MSKNRLFSAFSLLLCAAAAAALLTAASTASAQQPAAAAGAGHQQDRITTGSRIVRKDEATELETVTVGSVRSAREARLERAAADSDRSVPALPHVDESAFLDDTTR